ncbi:DUF5132 domain-containing protein [Sinorhizobium sp. 8-89]|uniref:DUF5132 domain-containing protein n=1 Tax=Sinorhizobium sp. 8-89 TaxID=3049089 RepID=UPI00386F6D89
MVRSVTRSKALYQGRVAVAELGEGYEDLVAEARAEMSAANNGGEPAEAGESAGPATRQTASKASTSRNQAQK